MLRKVVGASFVLVLCVGFTFAEEMMAVITKVDGGKVTFTEMKGKEKGDTKTLSVTDKVKVVKGKFNKETKKVEDAGDLDDGLKNKMFSEIGEKGIRAQIVTDADNKKITEIRILKGKKKDN
jgi:hypothetical protein